MLISNSWLFFLTLNFLNVPLLFTLAYIRLATCCHSNQVWFAVAVLKLCEASTWLHTYGLSYIERGLGYLLGVYYTHDSCPCIPPVSSHFFEQAQEHWVHWQCATTFLSLLFQTFYFKNAYISTCVYFLLLFSNLQPSTCYFYSQQNTVFKHKKISTLSFRYSHLPIYVMFHHHLQANISVISDKIHCFHDLWFFSVF